MARVLDRWQRTPWWAFWRPKWFRWVAVPKPGGRGYDAYDMRLEFATDVQAARTYLEETFGGR